MLNNKDFGNITYDSIEEKIYKENLVRHFRECPIPDNELLSNLGLFINSKNLSRILFMDHLYKQIIDVHGSIIEFGVRWGQNIALFNSLRGIYEPFNRHRKIIGFDTFTGFPTISEKDGNSTLMKEGNDAVSENYVNYLTKLLNIQESSSPLSHIKKFELIVGDANITIGKYLKEHPEIIIALAYFDFDTYEATKTALRFIQPHLTKGSVLGFDELNDVDSPGETIALMESFNLNTIKLKRYRYTSRTSYFVLE